MKKIVMETFAKRITQRRQQLGRTQREIANAIEVPLSTYKEWEYGRSVQGEKVYVALAEALEIPLKTLLTGEPQADSENVLEQIQTLIRLLNELKKSLQSAL